MTITNIINEMRDLVDADATSYPAAALTDAGLRRINAALEEIVGKLISLKYPLWNFGDSNFTSLPTGLITLVNSQEAYQLSGDQSTTGVDTSNPLLNVIGVSVKDNSGILHKLEPISLSQILKAGYDPAEYQKTDGRPQEYEKREDFLVLYPAPDNGVSVTLASGLKVFYQRRASLFTAAQVTTGTKEPGFASPWHILLAYKAALPYAMTYKPGRVSFIMSEINRLEKELFEFYANRSADEEPIITMSRKSYR